VFSKSRGAPPCPNGDSCKDRHSDEEIEIIHWTKYFNDRSCKHGALCRQDFCLYGHPPGERPDQSYVKECVINPEGQPSLLAEAAPCPIPLSSEELPARRPLLRDTLVPASVNGAGPGSTLSGTVCMTHLNAWVFDNTPCAQGESCSFQHPTDVAEIQRWVSIFKNMPCEAGALCQKATHEKCNQILGSAAADATRQGPACASSEPSAPHFTDCRYAAACDVMLCQTQGQTPQGMDLYCLARGDQAETVPGAVARACKRQQHLEEVRAEVSREVIVVGILSIIDPSVISI